MKELSCRNNKRITFAGPWGREDKNNRFYERVARIFWDTEMQNFAIFLKWQPLNLKVKYLKI